MLFLPVLPLAGQAIFGQNCFRGSMWLALLSGNQKSATGPSFFQPPRFIGVLPRQDRVSKKAVERIGTNRQLPLEVGMLRIPLKIIYIQIRNTSMSPDNRIKIQRECNPPD